MNGLSQRRPCLAVDRAARRPAHWTVLSLVWVATLAACRAPSPRVTAPDRSQASPDTRPLRDGSYDWYGLVIVPFGGVLQDIPVGLHEVLLFHDEAHSGAATDDAECYSADAPAPRFIGRTLDEYLLCFKQDRLSRIQASVRLSTDEASEVFATACAAWLKNAARAASRVAALSAVVPSVAMPSAATPGAEAPSAAAPSTPVPSDGPSVADVQRADTCEGRDGAIRFSGRIGEDPGRVEPPPADRPKAEGPRSETPQTETFLSITLDSDPNP